MSWLRFAKHIYSLDTLDTRFTAAVETDRKSRENGHSIANVKLPAQEILSSSKQKSHDFADVQPSRWRSKEFYFYALCFIVIPPLMCKSVYDASKEGAPNFDRIEKLLSPGWLFGRKVDNSDIQYAGFRDNIPYMTLVFVLHPVSRWVYDSFLWSASRPGTASASAPDSRLKRRTSFDFGFAVLFSLALHGISAFKVFFILYLNFQLATRLPRKYVPAAVWIFNIGTLFANELGQGYPLAHVATILTPSPTSGSHENASGSNWGAWLDGYGGLVPRWEILFNITVLRLLSYDFDYIWSLDSPAFNGLEKKKQLDPANLSDRDRVKFGAMPSDFTFQNYFAYVLYSPLYLTGPIMTFNEYISQSRYPPGSTTVRRNTLYGIRFLICLLTMEFVLHFMYAVAISKAQPTWEVYSPFQLSMLGYFNLHIIWLKLLIPWRFFRLWALTDGIDPPENMVRCASDSYSMLAFWKGWHRSYNRWLVRYLFIPIGGSHCGKFRRFINVLIIFTFVALWHDISLSLLVWGWLISLFVLPEIILSLLFPAKRWRSHPEAYRVLCGIGGVGTILMLMIANLVGFCVGINGLKGLVLGIVGTWSGLLFLVAACSTVFVGVQIMFEVRETEKREGYYMKC